MYARGYTFPLGASTYGDAAHLHAATAIGPSGGTATWTTSYDAAGNTACRAATTATTYAGTTPNSALLTYDNEGRLTAWQNIALVTTTPTSTPARSPRATAPGTAAVGERTASLCSSARRMLGVGECLVR